MLVSIVGQASRQTAGRNGPSTRERSYRRVDEVVLPGDRAGELVVTRAASNRGRFYPDLATTDEDRSHTRPR